MSVKKLFSHSSHYFLGEILVMGASLISFPIFTRIFSVQEYGALSILTTTFSLCCLFGSLGLRPSIVRFYNEYNKSKEDLVSFYSTIFSLTLLGGFVVTSLLLLSSFFSPALLPESQIHILRIGASLVLIRTLFTVALNFMRAEQKTLKYNVICVLQQYSTLSVVLVLVVFVRLGLLGLITGQLVIEGIFVIAIIGGLYKKNKIHYITYSKTIAKKVLSYGLPLIMMNFSNIFIVSGDRFVINWFLDLASVGIYSVGYSLSNYVSLAIVTPLHLAITPIYMEIWEKNGKGETQVFLSRITNYYLMIAIPIIFGICVLGQDILILLASDKFSSSFLVVPLLTGSILLSGFNFLNSAGMFLGRRTKLYGLLIFGVAVTNFVINICLIPLFGILGSALATFLSYIIQYFCLKYFSFKYCKITLNYSNILKYSIFSLIMFACLSITSFDSYTNFFKILFKSIEGLVIYFTFVYLFDKEIRCILKVQFNKYIEKLF